MIHAPSSGSGNDPATPPGRPASRADGQKRSGNSVLRHATDFLPLLLALALALGTFWLVRSMPQIRPDTPPSSNEPDYYLRDFELRRYDPLGNLQIELAGSYGEHIPGPDTIHVQQARTFSIDAHGTTTRASADRAVSDGKGQNIELFGQVHAVRQRTAEGGGKNGTPPPVIFESSYLKATNRQEHLSTDQPVKITQGNDVITGTGMTYTGASRTVNIQGRSQAVIQPHRQP